MRINVHALRSIMQKITKTSLFATAFGVLLSAFMQSHKAVVSIALSLINAEALSVVNALPILISTTIGASSTAFLVSAKLTLLEEGLIIAGAILKKIKKYKNIGHIVFYLGLLMFSLELMGDVMQPLKQNKTFCSIFSYSNNVFVLCFIGLLLSLSLQSGALVLSVLTILVSCDIIPLHNAIVISLGASIGSTLSLYLIAMSLNDEARKACKIHIAIVISCSFVALLFVDMFELVGRHFSNKSLGFAVANAMSWCSVAIMALLLFEFIKRNVNILNAIMKRL
jgi:phosphate:Na+ symporter